MCDYGTWERELLEDADLERHVAAGAPVPLNIGSDGVWEIEVRVGTAEAPATLTECEFRYPAVDPQPYRLRTGGRLDVSGLEYVADQPEPQVGLISLEPGSTSPPST